VSLRGTAVGGDEATLWRQQVENWIAVPGAGILPANPNSWSQTRPTLNMNNFFLRLFMAINVFFIRVSRGRLGARLGTQTILLLHTVGRKSGKRHTTPIAYFFLDGFYFLVASNWGKPVNAAWYYNLKHNSRASIDVGGKAIPVEASEALGAEYDRLWKYAAEHHPPYLHYQEMTSRHIPIVVLKPVSV
jgi:deazaflavin-dependent oxidoreductase (nitroreductase family)